MVKLPYFHTFTRNSPIFFFYLNNLAARDSMHFFTLSKGSEELWPQYFTFSKQCRTSESAPITSEVVGKRLSSLSSLHPFHLRSVRCRQCSPKLSCGCNTMIYTQKLADCWFGNGVRKFRQPAPHFLWFSVITDTHKPAALKQFQAVSFIASAQNLLL